MFSIHPLSDGKFEIRDGEVIIIKSCDESLAKAFHFYIDCADFVAKCSIGVLGHQIPAQNILLKHGVTCAGWPE